MAAGLSIPGHGRRAALVTWVPRCGLITNHIPSQDQLRVFFVCFILKGHNTQHSGHMGKKNVQTELMVEIYSKSLVRAIGKVLLVKFSQNTN